MFGLFNKSDAGTEAVGVQIANEGVAISVMCPSKDGGLPTARICEFVDANSRNEKAEALKALVDKHKLDDKPCVAVMPEGSYSLLQVEAPDVPADEMRVAIKWKIKDLIDFPLEEAVVDVFEMPSPARGSGNHVYTVAARASDVKHQVDLIEESGLCLKAIEIEELMQRNVTEFMPEAENGMVLLTFCHDKGLITLIKGDAMYLARDLDVGLIALADEEASSVDGLSIGSGGHHESILLELQRSVDFFSRSYAQPPLGRLFVYPDNTVTQSLVTYLDENMGLEAKILEASQVAVLDSDASCQAGQFSINAAGAAIRGLELLS